MGIVLGTSLTNSFLLTVADTFISGVIISISNYQICFNGVQNLMRAENTELRVFPFRTLQIPLFRHLSIVISQRIIYSARELTVEVGNVFR